MLRIMAEDHGRQRILLGDFNAPPDAPELAPLWDQLADAWRSGGVGPELTYPAAAPDRRIDYVTVSAKIGVRLVRVPYTLASDHLPLVADLTVTRGVRTGQTDHDTVHSGRALRYGTPAQAGLLAEHVARIGPDAAAFTEAGSEGALEAAVRVLFGQTAPGG
jgi:hypothetical protein